MRWGPVGLVMWAGLPVLRVYQEWKTWQLLEGSRLLSGETKSQEKSLIHRV